MSGILYADKKHIAPDTISGDYLTLARQIKAPPPMNSTTEPHQVHEGRNLKRIREILQVKQSTLATELGGDWNQKKVSQLEDRETIEPDLLEEIAHALKVPVEAIRNFDEEKAINIVASSFYDQSICYVKNYNPTFNPIDKLIEVYDENKKLYERLLHAEKEKIEMLEKLLKEYK